MDDLSRSDYPAIPAHLQPHQAVRTLEDRVKRISKINTEIADWLVERRRIEEQYVQSLRKLLTHKVPNAHSELGVFQQPWDRILKSAHTVAQSHHHFATRIEQDVELPLRSLHTRKEMQNVTHISGNLAAMAKELEDAQARSEKLSRKGGKPQKVDEAATKLESASQQWDAQAPFIFESLQALDESRCNQLRDLLTQYMTHESDKAQRVQIDAEETLNIILEVNTGKEIQDFAHQVTSGKPKLERRAGSARPSIAGSSLAPPSSVNEDDRSEGSGRMEPPHPESKLRRLGTMLGRRRQSIHGGFGQLSPQRGHMSRLGSSHGRVSPRTSSNNLTGEPSGRLSALAEQPNSPDSAAPPASPGNQPAENTNGIHHQSTNDESSAAAKPPNGTSDPEGQELEKVKTEDRGPRKDSEGFTVPAIRHDPISEAEKEAAEANGEGDQLFRLNIQKEPVAEEDPDAKKAALSNVANALTTMGMPSRKTGTIRGRRDVRSTIYVPGPDLTAENPFPDSPALSQTSQSHSTPHPPLPSKPILASEVSVAATSETQSVRSGNSLASVTPFQHPSVDGPGLGCSIIEAVSATLDDEGPKNVKVAGEIAFILGQKAQDRERIRINDFSSLETVHPNRTFVHPTDVANEFEVDTSHIPRVTPAFTYKMAIDPQSMTAHVPLLIKASWVPLSDSKGKGLGLLLQMSANGSSAAYRDHITLRNLTILANYGGRARSAQLKPPGTHIRERHVVYWRHAEYRAVAGEWDKAVCRLLPADGGSELQPGTISAKWEYEQPTTTTTRELGSGISVDRWVDNPSAQLLTGATAGRSEGKGKGKAAAALSDNDDDDDDPFADVPSTPGMSAAEGSEGTQLQADWFRLSTQTKTIAGRYEARGTVAKSGHGGGVQQVQGAAAAEAQAEEPQHSPEQGKEQQ